MLAKLEESELRPSIRVIGVRIDGTFQQVNGGSEVEASVGLLGLPKQIGRFGFGRRSSSDSFGTAHDVGVHIFVIADDFLKSFVVIPAGSRHFSGLEDEFSLAHKRSVLEGVR